MDDLTRHQRIAQRFPISILQRHGQDAPTVLRAWADDLDRLAEEGRGEGSRFRPTEPDA